MNEKQKQQIEWQSKRGWNFLGFDRDRNAVLVKYGDTSTVPTLNAYITPKGEFVKE